MAPYDISTRALIVSLKATGKSSNEIHELTKIPTRTIDLIYGRAIIRGFDPALRPLEINDSYLKDTPRSGKPSKRAEVTEKVVNTYAQSTKIQYISHISMADSTGSGLQKDQANEEAWIDTEDEAGTT